MSCGDCLSRLTLEPRGPMLADSLEHAPFQADLGVTSFFPGTRRDFHGTGQCHVDQAALPHTCSPTYSDVGVSKLPGEAQSSRQIGDRQDMLHWTLANMFCTKACDVFSRACRLRRRSLELRLACGTRFCRVSLALWCMRIIRQCCASRGRGRTCQCGTGPALTV